MIDINLAWKAALVAAALGAAGIAHFVFKAKDDNAIEQAAEKVIKNETGLEIDLSPDDAQSKK